MNNKISVLMSTYNEPLEWIDLSIESILLQTYSNIEFIIVCDNPKNKNLLNYLEVKSKEDSRIKIIINEENIGLARSLNKALLYSTGEFIARMDADDIAYNNRFEIEVQYLTNNSKIDFISGNVDIINENGEILKESKGISYSHDNLKKILPIVNVFVHPTFLARRRVYDSLKGYRDFPAAEDYDFVLRSLTSNFTMCHISETLIRYRMRQNSMGLGNALVSHLSTNYVKKLYKERENKNSDSYNSEELKLYVTIGEKDRRNYASVLYNIKVKNRRKKIILLLEVFRGCLISKYFRASIFNMLQIQIARKIYKD